MVTKEQKQINLALAYDILARIPEQRFNLEHWFGSGGGGSPLDDEKDCNTLACAAGWLSLSKPFRLNKSDLRFHNFDELFDRFAASKYDKAYIEYRLFGWREASRYDRELKSIYFNDKRLALYRLRREMGEDIELAKNTVLDCAKVIG